MLMAAPGARTIVCDVAHLAADGEALDALARLQLHARRRGHEIRLRRASHELRQLLELAGLGDVLRVEPGGQAE
jgi:ABC-type transporter Mla MlaB component